SLPLQPTTPTPTLHPFPTRRSSDLKSLAPVVAMSSQAGRIGAANLHDRLAVQNEKDELGHLARSFNGLLDRLAESFDRRRRFMRSEEHTSELQSLRHLVCRLLLEKK